jgi:hypothetical protein
MISFDSYLVIHSDYLDFLLTGSGLLQINPDKLDFSLQYIILVQYHYVTIFVVENIYARGTLQKGIYQTLFGIAVQTHEVMWESQDFNLWPHLSGLLINSSFINCSWVQYQTNNIHKQNSNHHLLNTLEFINHNLGIFDMNMS